VEYNYETKSPHLVIALYVNNPAAVSMIVYLHKILHTLFVAFYPRDAMLARVIAIATCPSVCHAPVLCQNEES